MKIERHPVAPLLNKKAIKLLTKLCFRDDDCLEKVDGVFIFGSTTGIEEMKKLIIDLLNKNIFQTIFISGGATSNSVKKGIKESEAEYVYKTLNISKFKKLDVFLEEKSQNTVQNVVEMLKIKDFSKYKKIIFIFKSHVAGRGYLSLKKYLPNTKIIQQTFNVKYPNAEKEISRENWHTFEFGRTRVWGEFLRIKEYGERGNIYYDNSIKQSVKEIENIVIK